MNHREPSVVRYSEADVPTEYGFFKIIVFRETGRDESAPVEHVAIVRGDVKAQDAVHVRVHSECLTGEVLHSLKCDCREQLDFGLRHIGDEPRGAVLYLRQEGRGIGLGNKIRAYALQQRGYDTVDANTSLGFGEDERSYDIAADMLADLGVRSVVLLTNNPAKVDGLREHGVDVRERLAVHIPPNEHSRDYLLTKRARMGHMLSPNLLDGLLLDAE